MSIYNLLEDSLYKLFLCTKSCPFYSTLFGSLNVVGVFFFFHFKCNINISFIERKPKKDLVTFIKGGSEIFIIL